MDRVNDDPTRSSFLSRTERCGIHEIPDTSAAGDIYLPPLVCLSVESPLSGVVGKRMLAITIVAIRFCLQLVIDSIALSSRLICELLPRGFNLRRAGNYDPTSRPSWAFDRICAHALGRFKGTALSSPRSA